MRLSRFTLPMPTEFQDALIALRDRYLAFVTTTEQQAHHVREHLNHINALLVDQRIAPRGEAIATAIYGNLSPARLTEVKKDIADRLAKGAKVGRWRRVPERLGVYVYS